MSRKRASGFNGAEAISDEQIYFWQRVHCFPLHEWEIAIVERLDDAWREVMHAKDAK